jgi:hypothetical protein
MLRLFYAQPMPHPLITRDQREVLLLACEELLGPKLDVLRGRLNKPAHQIGADLELVCLFAGLTIGDAKAEGSDSWDTTWTPVSGRGVCVEGTHIQPTDDPRPLAYLEFRREVETQLQRHGISDPWNIRLLVVGSRGESPKIGNRSDWQGLFATEGFRTFAALLKDSAEQKSTWTARENYLAVLADGPEYHQSKEPVELPFRAQSHPLYRAVKAKAAQLARVDTGRRPTLVVISATDAVDTFSRFSLFHGDIAGPCRWAFGGLGAGDLEIAGGRLVQHGTVQNHRRISAVRLLLPWKPNHVDFTHRTDVLVVNSSADITLSPVDCHLVSNARFVTWRDGQLPEAKLLAMLARNNRDTLCFNILPLELRMRASGFVYFGDSHDAREETMNAIALAQELKARGAILSLSDHYLRLPSTGPFESIPGSM